MADATAPAQEIDAATQPKLPVLLVMTISMTVARITQNALSNSAPRRAQVHVTDDAERTRNLAPVADAILVDWDDSPGLAEMHLRLAVQRNPRIHIGITGSRDGLLQAHKALGHTRTDTVTKPLQAKELLRFMQRALAPPPSKSEGATHLDVSYINPFIEATNHVLRSMASISTKRRHLCRLPDHRLHGDVVGVMPLAGAATGFASVGLSAHLSAQVYARILSIDPPPRITDEVCDTVGELINMIAGQAKTRLEATEYCFRFTLPKVYFRPQNEMPAPPGAPNIALFQEAMELPLVIQVCLAPQPAPPTP